jgi:hypothetical protein
MSYFSHFPNMLYDFTKQGTQQPNLIVVKDIIRRVKLNSTVANSLFAYDEYDIQEGERPDILAHQFYNSSKLAWIILVTNEIHDVYEDWPRTGRELNNMMKKKYGADIDTVHHYERPQLSGDITKNVITTELSYLTYPSPGTTLSVPTTAVTNRQYEEKENEKKRRIKILRANLVQEFVSEFKSIIKD